MKYLFMLFIAFIMAIFSSALTAFGMAELFTGIGTFILVLFFVIDLGRFILFNFTVDEWNNLRKIKYFIVFILTLLFMYSAVGVFSKLSSLVSEETKQAMLNTVQYNKAVENAQIKQNRTEDLALIAKKEYEEALKWNKNDLKNCIRRANGSAVAENRCNNTKRALDIKASNTLKEMLSKADISLDSIQETTEIKIQNQGKVANVITTVCKLTQKTCNDYDHLQNALTIVIILVIIGTDYLQIAIILAVNTRKNKIIQKRKEEIIIEKEIIKNSSSSNGNINFITNTTNFFKKILNIKKQIQINNNKSNFSGYSTNITKIIEKEPIIKEIKQIENKNIEKIKEKENIIKKEHLSKNKLQRIKDFTKKMKEKLKNIDKNITNFEPKPH